MHHSYRLPSEENHGLTSSMIHDIFYEWGYHMSKILQHSSSWTTIAEIGFMENNLKNQKKTCWRNSWKPIFPVVKTDKIHVIIYVHLLSRAHHHWSDNNSRTHNNSWWVIALLIFFVVITDHLMDLMKDIFLWCEIQIVIQGMNMSLIISTNPWYSMSLKKKHRFTHLAVHDFAPEQGHLLSIPS